MKRITKGQVLVWVLALVPLILAAAVYSRLPDRIPMQWDFGGEVGYEPKWHLCIVAGLSPLLAVLFYVLPNLDPKKRNYDKFFGSYVGFQIMMMLFMIVMNGICVVEGLRPGTLNIPMVVCLIVSIGLIACVMVAFGGGEQGVDGVKYLAACGGFVVLIIFILQIAAAFKVFFLDKETKKDIEASVAALEDPDFVEVQEETNA